MPLFWIVRRPVVQMISKQKAVSRREWQITVQTPRQLTWVHKVGGEHVDRDTVHYVGVVKLDAVELEVVAGFNVRFSEL